MESNQASTTEDLQQLQVTQHDRGPRIPCPGRKTARSAQWNNRRIHHKIRICCLHQLCLQVSNSIPLQLKVFNPIELPPRCTGLVRDDSNKGYIFMAFFPRKKVKIKFFVPSVDYAKPQRFLYHLVEQYPHQVINTAERGLWHKFICEHIDVWENSPEYKQVHFVKNIGLQVPLFDEEDMKSISFCFGKESKDNFNYRGIQDPRPPYFFFPFLSAQGYSYRGPKFLESLDIKFGGKEALRSYFTCMVPGNEMQSFLALAAAMSSFYGQIIRSKFGQLPITVLLSESKGTGKSSTMKAVMWATSRCSYIFNNPSSAEYILSKASSSTLMVGLDDNQSLSKEERIFISVFDRATCEYFFC